MSSTDMQKTTNFILLPVSLPALFALRRRFPFPKSTLTFLVYNSILLFPDFFIFVFVGVVSFLMFFLAR
jgi:hypothetical protein